MLESNVIAVSFQDDRCAYKALTSLEELDSQQRVLVRDAVVVLHDEDGQVVVKDRIESTFPSATAGGGLVGLLIGVIGGPLGVVVGGISGLVVGSLVDVSDIEDADSALAAISSSVALGHTALLAAVDEQTPEAVNAAMADLDGSVVRRPVADVEAEIAAAESAERTSRREELTTQLHHERQTGTDDAATPAGGAP